MALEDILKKIEKKNKKDIGRIKKEAKKKCMDINKETERLTKEFNEENRRASDLKAKKLKESMLQNARLKLAQEILKTKSSAINAIFEEALNRLKNLPADDYVSWVNKTILRTAEPGENEIILPPKFLKVVDTTKFLEDVNKKLKSKSRIKFSKNSQKQGVESGFILKKQRKEINCSFQSLLDEKRNDIRLKVNKILFKNP